MAKVTEHDGGTAELSAPGADATPGPDATAGHGTTAELDATANVDATADHDATADLDATTDPGATSDLDATSDLGQAAVVGERVITVGRGEPVAVCCSGGGIRSATFNLGVLQALQAAEVFDAVTTVTAVSGGSYVAAAHALVTANPAAAEDGRPDSGHPGDSHPAGGHPDDTHPDGSQRRPLPPPQAYALRSPEELHLRDHTRYLLETWQVGLRAIAVLIRGVLVNAILVGSVLFITAHAAGWLLGGSVAGILTRLRTGAPVAALRWYWIIPAAGAVATVVLAWLHALPPQRPAERHSGSSSGRADEQPGGWRLARDRVVSWLRGQGQARRLPPRQHPARPSNRALAFTLLTAGVLVAAPLAIRGLYTVSLGSGSWSVITRFLGFANAPACQAAASAPDAAHHVCGAVVQAPAAVRQNGRGASTWSARLATFGSVAAAIVALARATMGRLRTYQADLSKSGLLAGLAAKAGGFLQRRLVPWAGAALIVGIIVLLSLRWIGDGASRPPLAGGWTSDGADCLYAAAAFLLVKAVTDINATSMHAFYRDRLAAAYGVVRQAGEAVDAPWALLSTLAGTGQPDLVICAAANCTDGGSMPPGRGSVSFTFTPDDIGLSREPRAGGVAQAGGDRAATTSYEEALRLTLFDAVAVSGAAVSPVMGKMTRPSMRIVLAAADVRLGVWLPSPRVLAAGTAPARSVPARGVPVRSAGLGEPGERNARRGRVAGPAARLLRRACSAALYQLRQPDVRHLWAEAAGWLHLDGRWLYVTDGGHYENLGMVEALRRGPAHLVVIDAAGDAPGRFATLGQAIALARSEVGVQVDIDPSALAPDATTGQCRAPYASGTFSYPGEDPVTGPRHHLVYFKLAVPAGAPWDVIAYQQLHPSFPTESTLQQLYDDSEFEAYRELGYHCALAALADIKY